MKCDVKDINGCTKELSVQVPSGLIQEHFDKFYKEISVSARVPGFRQGKAPRKVLEMHYKEEAKDEVLKRVISHSYQDVLQQKNITPFGYPAINDVNFSDSVISYKAIVELRPDVQLKKYKAMSVKKGRVSIEEKEIDEVVEHVRDNYAKFIPVEDRGVELGDFAICDIESHVEGQPPQSKKDEWCEIKPNDMLKGFAEATVSMKPGDAKDIEVTLSKDFPNEAERGKKALFKVVVKEIKKKEIPTLDTELLNQLGGYASVDELRAAIKKDIQQKKEQDVEMALERSIVDQIEKGLTFDVPESVVLRRLDGMVEDSIAMLVRRGYQKEEAEKQREDLKKQFNDEARRQVKVAFILDKIADLEKIDATQGDIENRLNTMAKQIRQPVEVVRDYYEKNNLIDQMYAEIRNQKVIDFLKQHADIK